ncbi:ankyrin repeat-containing domain protein [Dactylonectria macrodidyma]|uniref:Ankyrin repeat-containing domain protein n=1 Tax=Dactylonectria macrodidyma TaxID=307937 RepID=A0A9P9JQ23_9HYPO|nr:ankyrin repeat-containing domain protein [Dactylonectria macrodidyma]
MSIVDITKKLVVYLNDARACGKDMSAMMVEVRCASGMLQSLAELAKLDDSWVRTLHTLAGDAGPLQQANDIVQELERKLKPQHGMGKLAKALDMKAKPQIVTDKFPLIEYAARFWPSHLQVLQNGKSDGAAAELSARLLCGSLQLKDKVAFDNWIFTARPDLPWTGSAGAGTAIGTPLYYACLLDLVATAKLLLERGCDPNGTGRYGSCLNAAILHKSEEIIQMLLTAGADVRAAGCGGMSVGLAVKSGSVAVMTLLFDRGAEVGCFRNSRDTPLPVAARIRHEELVRLLLAQGANLNAQNNNGHRPLQVATLSGRTGVVNILVDNGADVMERFARSTTLLHSVSSAEKATRLIEPGIPMDNQDDDGYNPSAHGL